MTIDIKLVREYNTVKMVENKKAYKKNKLQRIYSTRRKLLTKADSSFIIKTNERQKM